MARGEGFRCRLAPIEGETPQEVLPKLVYLPALLGQLDLTETFGHTDFQTVAAGEFSQPSRGSVTARPLREMGDLETLTVEWDPVWLVERGQDPEEVYRRLFAIGRSRKPVQLTIAARLDQRATVQMNITFRSIQMQIRKGEPDTVYYAIRIKEWRDATGRRRRGNDRPRGSKLPTTHKITASDTLHSLSKHYYHSYQYADDIARFNGIKGFGVSTSLVQSKRFKLNDKLKIPGIKVEIVDVNRGEFDDGE